MKMVDVVILVVGVFLIAVGRFCLTVHLPAPIEWVARIFGLSWTIVGAYLSCLGVAYLFQGLRRAK